MGDIPNAGFHRNKPQSCINAIVCLKLAGGVFTMPVNRAGLNAQFARDLLGIEMRVHQTQALALALCQ